MHRLNFHIGERLSVHSRDGRCPSFSTIHEEVLLAAALLHHPRELSRGVVASLMWPGQSQPLALQSLRQRLTAINSKLPGVLEADRKTIRVCSSTTVTLASDREQLGADSVLNQAKRLLKSCQDHVTTSDLGREADRIVEDSASGFVNSSHPVQFSAHLALDTGVALEDRLDTAIALLANPSLSDDRDQLIALAREIAFSEATTTEFSRRQWFACQAGAMLTHRSGIWTSAYQFQARASQIARSIGDAQRLHWSEFRRIRIDIDMGLNSRNTAELTQLARTPDLTPRLRAMCELNLIFALAPRGQHDAVNNLVVSCRRSPQIEADWQASSWLALNEAVSSIALRSPQNGVSALLRAARAVEGKMGSLDGVWHWMTAAQVFGAMGHSEITAEFSAMAGRSLQAINAQVSPQNARMYNAIVAHSARNSSPSKWLEATEAVADIPLPELHAHYERRLKEAALLIA